MEADIDARSKSLEVRESNSNHVASTLLGSSIAEVLISKRFAAAVLTNDVHHRD
jgi:hypothetical protein